MLLPDTIFERKIDYYFLPLNDAYARDRLLEMCVACGVDVPDFSDVSNLSAIEFRQLGMSLAAQLPEESLTEMLPEHWAAAHPSHGQPLKSMECYSEKFCSIFVARTCPRNRNW